MHSANIVAAYTQSRIALKALPLPCLDPQRAPCWRNSGVASSNASYLGRYSLNSNHVRRSSYLFGVHFKTHPVTRRCVSSPARAQHAPDFADLLFRDGKITDITHSVWRRIVRPGDLVVDASCGNGNDSLALANMIFGTAAPGPEDYAAVPLGAKAVGLGDALSGMPAGVPDGFQTGNSMSSSSSSSPPSASWSTPGRLVCFDIQARAIESTKSLLQQHLPSCLVNQNVRFEQQCHSRLLDVVSPQSARLVCFNLGYLPGGDKSVVTSASTTLTAVQAALDSLVPGGLLSVVAYTGHEGGRTEYEALLGLVSALPRPDWACWNFVACLSTYIKVPASPVPRSSPAQVSRGFSGLGLWRTKSGH
eukprot:jgi/Mesvir1/21455/Mv25021-RA.1